MRSMPAAEVLPVFMFRNAAVCAFEDLVVKRD